MSIATYLNTGLAILGWAYIMVKTGQWITKNALRQWDKRRKESRRQKAVNEFYDAFELNSLQPGSTVRLATKGDLTIMMFRSEGGRQMSNRIPNFGWNRLKLATLTYEQLAQLEEQVKAEHACKNGIHLFDKAGQRKLDALSWAVYNKQKAERAA